MGLFDWYRNVGSSCQSTETPQQCASTSTPSSLVCRLVAHALSWPMTLCPSDSTAQRAREVRQPEGNGNFSIISLGVVAVLLQLPRCTDLPTRGSLVASVRTIFKNCCRASDAGFDCHNKRCYSTWRIGCLVVGCWMIPATCRHISR